MQGKMKRKLTAVVVAFTLVFGGMVPFTAYADESNTPTETVVFTEEVALTAADNFASSFYPEENLEVSSAVTFCNSNGDKGYIVNFLKDENPYGYVILDPSLEDLVAEYSIGDNAKSPYDVIVEDSGNINARSLEDPSMVQISPLEYGIVDRASDRIYTNSGVETDLDGIMGDGSSRAKDPSTWQDATIPISILYRDYTITASGNLPQWASTTQDRVIELTGRYACTVTAYFAIAGYYGLVDLWNDGQAYLDIWNYTGTYQDPYNPDTSILWGATNVDDGAVGFVNYLASRGKHVTQRTTSGKPTFEEYVTSVNNQDASVMHGWLWNQDGTMTGHTMFVEGYIRALSKTDWNSLRILQVFDGWYSGVRYINYDFASYA
ncbi:hypothetical protein [Gordonibacter sp. An230]|uniref:hypothetical protein n=1 Tax=Gordonibacter sp. An230 TaxID=1965592 RepID=UPI0011237987|nr:hypothetical protein [Gordonibacter sp. An230]